jgi:hypothetical protein
MTRPCRAKLGSRSATDRSAGVPMARKAGENNSASTVVAKNVPLAVGVARHKLR